MSDSTIQTKHGAANIPAESSVRISYLSETPGQLAAWDYYVRSHPQGSIFHLVAWKRLIENSFGHRSHYLLAENCENGEIAGVLPLFLVTSLIFGRMLISTPQAAYGGILGSSAKAHEALERQAKALAQEHKVEFLELRHFEYRSVDSSLSTKDLYVTFRQELFEDPEKNMQAIPRKTRAEIREGIRNQLEFQVNAIGVKEFYSIYSRSLRDLGTPVFPVKLFSKGLDEYGPECKIFSVHWKGKIVAAVWTLFYKDQVLPYYGGSIREYNRLAVNNFMYWMLIKYGCEHGYRIFDFGRSKKGTGSFDFKKRWGMTMSDLPYQYFLVRRQSLPDTSPLNPKFSLAVRTWRRLPLFVTNSVGPLIAKQLT